jgi:hypothetical protein
MPNRTLEEENIDRNLAHFQQHGQDQPIQAWRQRIENKDAQLARRPPNAIDVEQAVKDFRHALLGDAGHSETAKALFRVLLRPVQPKLTYQKLCEAVSPTYAPSTLSTKQQAYVWHLEQKEQDRLASSAWPRRLYTDARAKAEAAEAAPTEAGRKLLNRQSIVLEEMGEALAEAEIMAGKIAGSKARRERQKFGRLMMRAVRNGLIEHPLVMKFVEAQVLTAGRSLLRKSRLGLEKLISIYLRPEDFDTDRHIVRLWCNGLSLRAIQRHLKTNHLLPSGKTLSHVAIADRLKQLGKESPWLYLINTHRPLPSKKPTR